MNKNYSWLMSQKNQIKFFVYSLDETTHKKFSNAEGIKSYFVGSYRGTNGHCQAVKAAFANIKSVKEVDCINIIADTDTVVLQKNWDQILIEVLSSVDVLGSTYEPYGGFSSGTTHIQTYKNKPNLSWFAFTKNVDFSKLDLTPNKSQHLAIDTAELSEIYQLPVGFFLLRDTGWQIPKFIHDNNVPYKILTHEKPTRGAKILKTDNEYNEEFQLEGLPFVAHQRGSMGRPFRIDPLSSSFYSVLDSYFERIKDVELERS